MSARLLISVLLASLGAVVVSSFGYGLHRLFATDASARSASRAREAAREAFVAEQLRRAGRERRQGKLEPALVTYRGILAEGPSVPAQLGLAEVELLAGREELAAREFERVLALDPRNAGALPQLARIYALQAKSRERAEGLYRTYLNQRPVDAKAQLGLARVLAWQGKSAEAAELYAREGVRRLMGEADRRDHAFALVGAGRIDEAEPLLRKLRASRPDDRALTRQLAGIHASRREWATAIPLYRSLVEGGPEDPQVQLEYGHALLATGKAGEAVGPLGKAARALPSSGEAGLAHARALRSAGDRKAAAREFERILPLHARDAAVLREYADLLLERRDYEAAEKHYREALRLGLRDPRLRVALAGALQARGKAKEAVPLLEEALAREPSDRLAFDLAKLYRGLGRNEDALDLLRRIERREFPSEAAPQASGAQPR